MAASADDQSKEQVFSIEAEITLEVDPSLGLESGQPFKFCPGITAFSRLVKFPRRDHVAQECNVYRSHSAAGVPFFDTLDWH